MTTKTTTGLPPPVVPALEPGDHLTRDEFERRYEAMPHVKKAELVEGVVYLPSPVRLDQHGSPQAALVGWLWNYWAFTPGVRVGDNSTVRLDLDNEPQPDALMIREPSHGGRVMIGPRGYVEGAPELVGEIAGSSASFDLHTKLRVYRRNQVQEYIVWRVQDAAVDWFVLRQGDYACLPLTAEGVYRSEVFPGLWLDPAALVRTDLRTVLSVLQQGMASQEYAAYVATLQQAAAQAPKIPTGDPQQSPGSPEA
jgi:Putative restriction endonuclease